MLKPKKKVRVNVRTLVVASAIRTDKRNGRDVIIVPSQTLPDNIVMNGIKYPAEEIEKSYKSLNRTPAPYGHPMLNGSFVSAKDPEGLNQSYIGAWNENVTRKNGVVSIDKIIDVEFAKNSAKGQEVLNAIEAGDPIHTSTGLICDLYDPEGDDHDYLARNMRFDHDAILLNEEGAATPEQGVGMFVNLKGDELEVVNSALSRAEDGLDWAVEDLSRAIERVEKAKSFDAMKDAILSALGLGTQKKPATNLGKDAEMNDEKFDELSSKVDALTESLNSDNLGKIIGDAIGNALKPVTDGFKAIEADKEAANAAELKGYTDTIVAANLLTEDAAAELTLAAAKELAATVNKSKSKKAAPMNSAFGSNTTADDEFADYDPNKAIDNATKKEG